ncbi:hypothetical protein B0A54_05966 [Friedmanniomyces endolithicus]|uniref:Patatin-like phospholipase domain-containing protein n=1 Tax=Friedmanniomyces endolithicus TaxID=329885 RepID=A0A4U0V2Y8_9PEZI|nr:Lipase 5 [Friedmanniomyces endolithicus]TKA43018.1 hypothetical protein B0A54_05966 [Friedmanniomyces endolithicus]
MELLTGTRWHGVRFRGEDEDGGQPSKRLRLSKSISVLQPVTRFVRSPLDTIGNLAESLGYNAHPPLSQHEEQKQVYLARLQTAETYDEWRTAALELDEMEDGEAWKAEEESDIYDVALVRSRLQSLESARENRDFGRMRFLTRTSLTRDLGGMGNVSLYKHSRVGTKALIEHYIDTVVDTIEMVVEEAGAGVGRGRDAKRVWEEMKLARQSFGRSALLLSGGGTLGMNHIGVVKALFEAGLLPRIISGASAGSIVCAVLCTKTDPEIPDVLHEFCHGELDVFESEGEGLLHKITRFFTQGAIYDISNLKRVMEGLIGTITFQEAYNRTRRILNICVSNAGLRSIVCGPSVFSAADLLAKDPKTGRIKHFDDSPSKWIDGSVDNDLPMMRLAEMLNVNHFIVSQVNPHVVPFLAREEDEAAPETSNPTAAPLAPGPGWINSAANLAKSEALHRMHVLAELGVFPNVMTKVRSVIGQRYAGDITIMPEISYAQFPNILRNPTETFMVQALRNGERATWPKLSRIRNHLAVELKLDWAVRKMLTRVAFSQSQVDLRMNVFARPVKNGRSERGRSRPGSKASKMSAASTMLPRRPIDRQTAHRVVQSMHEPPTTAISSPVFAQKIAGPEPTDYTSSTDDEAHSPRSTSPTPVTDDDYNSSDAASDASESPPSPPPDLWPANRDLFPSASQPATPSMASKAFLSDSPTSTRAPTPLPADLIMTPSPPTARTSSPEMRYKRLFHGKMSPMPTIRSQAGTPEPRDEAGQKGSGLFRRRSGKGVGLDLPASKGGMGRRSRRNSTGAPGLRPPDKR